MENALRSHGCVFSVNHLRVCLQVIKWIEEHGETFLLKHTGVGKSLVKAEALLKRHEEFESIAQVSEFEREIQIFSVILRNSVTSRLYSLVGYCEVTNIRLTFVQRTF